MAVAVPVNGQLQPADQLTHPWRERITHAKRHHKRYHKQWHLNTNFAQGRQWLEWHDQTERMVFPSELKAKLRKGLRLYTADRLTQYVWTAVATLLEGGDFRPEVAFVNDGQVSEDFAHQANHALAYAWDNELYADDLLLDLALLVVVYGTAGVRCRFDPTIGPVLLEQAVFVDGRPLLSPAEAQEAVIASMQGQGPPVEIRPLRGQITWDLLSPWHLLTPVGIARERDFPWEIVQRPEPLDSVLAEYPHAEGILHAQDLSALDAMGMKDMAEPETGFETAVGKLEDHLMVYTCYERPTRQFPQGQELVLAGDEYLPLDHRGSLSYRGPCGAEWRSGITYFHWWRRARGFFSRAPIEPGIDIQRAYNVTRTRQKEIEASGMPYVLAEEGSLKQPPRGLPMEIVSLRPGARPPAPQPGIGPGPWMIDELEIMARDMEAAVGIRDVTLGDNPANVTTFSGLALLNENDRKKLAPIGTRFRHGIARLVEDTIHDMRRYWPPDKQIAIAGSERLVDAVTFTAAQMPEAYYVRPQKGGTLPRGQAAELQKVNDIIGYCLQIGFLLPPSWVKEAYDQGQAPALPELPQDAHREKARWENEQMVAQYVPAPVAYYDDPESHMPEHRDQQITAHMAGDVQLEMVLEQHCQMHILVAMQQMQQAQAAQAQAESEQAEAEGERGDRQAELEHERSMEREHAKGGE